MFRFCADARVSHMTHEMFPIGMTTPRGQPKGFPRKWIANANVLDDHLAATEVPVAPQRTVVGTYFHHLLIGLSSRSIPRTGQAVIPNPAALFADGGEGSAFRPSSERLEFWQVLDERAALAALLRHATRCLPPLRDCTRLAQCRLCRSGVIPKPSVRPWRTLDSARTVHPVIPNPVALLRMVVRDLLFPHLP
jgi:hypothetical protein